MTTAFADVDQVLDKIQRAGHIMHAVDIWAVQLYRGYSFGSWFKKAQDASKTATNHKAFLVTEYGVDAYHDVCGHDPKKSLCFNQLGDNSGSHEDEGTQALWNRNLTLELEWHSSSQPMCQPGSEDYYQMTNLTGDDQLLNETCVVAGGFVYSWVDEYWKGSYVAAECHPNFWDPGFTIDQCEYKAHVTCANWNASIHDLCGQPLHSSPDHYQNEEWFGITTPTKCADSMDECARRPRARLPLRTSLTWRRASPSLPRRLRLRKVYWALREEWTGGLNNASIRMPSCANIAACPADCSGRGECVTDHKLCGPASAEEHSGAPCCKCFTGWAGEKCDRLDARTKLTVGSGFSVLLLIASVLLSFGVHGAGGPRGGRERSGPC